MTPPVATTTTITRTWRSDNDNYNNDDNNMAWLSRKQSPYWKPTSRNKSLLFSSSGDDSDGQVSIDDDDTDNDTVREQSLPNTEPSNLEENSGDDSSCNNHSASQTIHGSSSWISRKTSFFEKYLAFSEDDFDLEEGEEYRDFDLRVRGSNVESSCSSGSSRCSSRSSRTGSGSESCSVTWGSDSGSLQEYATDEYDDEDTESGTAGSSLDDGSTSSTRSESGSESLVLSTVETDIPVFGIQNIKEVMNNVFSSYLYGRTQHNDDLSMDNARSRLRDKEGNNDDDDDDDDDDNDNDGPIVSFLEVWERRKQKKKLLELALKNERGAKSGTALSTQASDLSSTMHLSASKCFGAPQSLILQYDCGQLQEPFTFSVESSFEEESPLNPPPPTTTTTTTTTTSTYYNITEKRSKMPNANTELTKTANVSYLFTGNDPSKDTMKQDWEPIHTIVTSESYPSLEHDESSSCVVSWYEVEREDDKGDVNDCSVSSLDKNVPNSQSNRMSQSLRVTECRIPQDYRLSLEEKEEKEDDPSQCQSDFDDEYVPPRVVISVVEHCSQADLILRNKGRGVQLSSSLYDDECSI